MDTKNSMLKRDDVCRVFDAFEAYPIIAICAPAGFGKTIAVSQWLEGKDCVNATFNIDEYDNVLTGFCERFCNMLRSCQPDNEAFIEIISHPSFQSAPDIFTLQAIAVLSTEKKTVLVLDDLHLIDDDSVMHFFLVLIKRLPKNFQVIIISRNELPAIFSTLRLKNQIAFIDKDKLSFTNDEILKLYEKRGYNISEEQLAEISQESQGWALGINALLLAGGQISEKALNHIGDFVRTSIWDNWEESTKEFMLNTAALNDIIPALCDELTGRSDSDEFLEKLMQEGIFVTRKNKGTYQYHHIFQEFLMNMVRARGEEFLQSLLEKEGRWHLSQRNFFRAINCFIQCENNAGIIECFELFNTFEHYNFLASKLLPIIKNPVVQNVAKEYPPLLYLMIWGAFAEGRRSDMVSYMDEYYARHVEILETYPSHSHRIFHVWLIDFRMDAKQIIAKSIIMPNKSAVSPERWSTSMQMPLLHRGIRDFSVIATGNVVVNVSAILSIASHWMFGDESQLIAEFAKAALLYEQGNIERANIYAVKAVAAVKSHYPTELKLCAYAILLNVLDALGKKNSKDALEAKEAIAQLIDREKAYHLSYNYQAFETHREILVGNVKAAEEWLADNEYFEIPEVYRTYAGLVTSRALILTEKYDSACVLLERILNNTLAFNRTLDTLEAQILLAIAYSKRKQGYQEQALKYLEDAIRVAQPCNYVQMFINNGAELAPMLQLLVNRIKQDKKKDSNFSSFCKMLYLKTRGKVNLTATSADSNVKYTEKQIAIMHLICQGKSYKEMSEALDIKQSTLRSHLDSIYNKLQVGNITDAATKIEAIGLLK